MFDKNLFDRNAYDRSVSEDGINGFLYATSSMRTQIVIAYPIPLRTIRGQGDLNPGLLLATNVGTPMAGVGEFENTPIILRMAISCNMSGSGRMTPRPTVITPIHPNKMTGEGDFQSRRDYVRQVFAAPFDGQGDIRTEMVMRTSINIDEIEGTSELTGELVLQLPLTINMSGTSEFILRRLSALNESIFELDGINLMPGESVTIDTDILVVLFGSKEDVSSVTTDSVFFELSPGENDISIKTDSGGELNVTAIWQNRWL